jgi:hypothetical protein
MDNVAAVQEALRRRAGLGDSGAGIPGGAQAANAPRPSNPIAQQGQIPMQNPNAPTPPTTMPSAQDPFGGASAMMNASQPVKGGTAIEKALVKRMNMYPPA